MPDLRLRKEERLKSRKRLAMVFAEGKSFQAFPIRFVWCIVPKDGSSPVQVAFSVSRRRWKSAVERNLFKRRMREAYRLHKHILYQTDLPADRQILLAIIYTSSASCPFEQIQAAMTKSLQRLTGLISQTT